MKFVRRIRKSLVRLMAGFTMNVLRRIRRGLILLAAGFFVVSVGFVLLYGVLPPPVTPLMVIRLVEGEGLSKHWRSYDEISPHLVRAVLASEDSRFCEHSGFDWEAMRKAIAQNLGGGQTVGASTITMQTAKNLFLWPSRTYMRKGLEAYFTVLIELFWNKQRIIETYVNVAEWGTGIYGAEAAAQAHFGKSADKLTRREAALLAAVLPNPRHWSASRPTNYINRRAATIQARMRIMPDGGPRICG